MRLSELRLEAGVPPSIRTEFASAGALLATKRSHILVGNSARLHGVIAGASLFLLSLPFDLLLEALTPLKLRISLP